MSRGASGLQPTQLQSNEDNWGASEMIRPLENIRVLDLTRHLAGAGATRILGQLGAEILRIEWPHPPALDFVRLLAPQLDGIPGIDRGGFFAQINVEKKSIAIDLSGEAGREIFRSLVPHCDVVIESFAVGVMRRWGFDFESLHDLKHDIVFVSCPAFGHTGPYRDYRSYGPTAQAYAGLTATVGLPDREPAGWGFSYMDHMGAVMNAAAVMMALERRRRTGRGDFIDAAQCQEASALLGPMLLDAAINHIQIRPRGNRDLYRDYCPSNVYRCRGTDRWIAISVRSDEEWRRLRKAMGDPEWATRPELETRSGRLASEDEIDQWIAEWASQFEVYDLMEKLQSAGVAAGVVQTIIDQLERDSQLRHRGLFTMLDHPVLGVKTYVGTPVKMSSLDLGLKRRSPQLGEHTREVLTELLGYSHDKINDLVANKVIAEAEPLSEEVAR